MEGSLSYSDLRNLGYKDACKIYFHVAKLSSDAQQSLTKK